MQAEVIICAAIADRALINIDDKWIFFLRRRFL